MTALRESSRPLVGPLQVDPSLDSSSSLTRFRALAMHWVLAATAIRFVCVSSVPLGNGEAYYFTWSRFLSWSYYDHPPLVAWMERLVAPFEPSLALIRLGPILCSAAFGLLFFRLAERFFGGRAAFLSLVLVTSIPVFLATSFVLNPEAPLAPLWVGYLLVLERMRERDDASLPLAAGALLGFAFLAKYTALLLVPATFLYLVCSAPARRWLRRPSFYAGGAIAFVVSLPVLYWNVVHDWPTLKLHLVERASVAVPVAGENTISHLIEDASTPGSSVLERVLRVLMGQALAYSPLFAPMLAAGLVRVLRGARRDDRDLFLAAFSWPALVPLLVAMMRLKDSEPHWTMVALLPAVIAAGRAADEALGHARGWTVARRLPLFSIGVAASALLFALGTLHTHTDAIARLLPSKRYDPRADMTSELAGWNEVRARMQRAAAAAGDDAVLASNQYAVCGRLFVESGDSPRVYCPTERRSAFDFFERRDPPADAAVVVLTSDIHPEIPERLADRQCASTDTFTIERAGRAVAHYDVHTCAPANHHPEESASLRTFAPQARDGSSAAIRHL